MEQAQYQQIKLNLKVQKTNVDLIVHIGRILVKLGMIAVLFYSGNQYALPLSIYLIISETLDQITIIAYKRFVALSNLVPVFYIINSVLVITVVIQFAGWTNTDAYLIYLIHISSATVAYGFRYGILSFVLSMLAYTGLMFANVVPPSTYLRLPIISVIVLRLLVSRRKAEKTETALDNLLEIEKSKQDFIALASHNLRTPVAAIYGYIDLLLRKGSTELSTQLKDYIEKIKQNNQELEKLTESVLQISIFEIGKEISLFKQPAQIEVLISDIVQQFQVRANAKNIDLKFIRPESLLPMVNIDIEKIKSALSNLIDNAVKYTTRGEIRVTALLADQKIDITVTDSGIGIPPEDLPKVFNKFFRSGNVLVYNQIGTGLGLYLGKQIIERHGGEIKVESVKDQGTTFTISLPVMKESE